MHQVESFQFVHMWRQCDELSLLDLLLGSKGTAEAVLIWCYQRFHSRRAILDLEHVRP